MQGASGRYRRPPVQAEMLVENSAPPAKLLRDNLDSSLRETVFSGLPPREFPNTWLRRSEMKKEGRSYWFGRLVSFFLLVGLLSAGQALGANFSQLVVIGDSLSDSGNISLATGGAVPGSFYFQGRFTNGPTYADQLGMELGLPVVPSLAGGTNFAFGGARTDTHGSGQPFDILSQVQMVKASGILLDPNTLVVLFAGANNLQDAVFAAAQTPKTAIPNGLKAVKNAVGDLKFALNELVAAGAKNILVMNAPNIGLTPRIKSLKTIAPGIEAYTKALTLLFNLELDQAAHRRHGVTLYRFDTFSFFNDVVGNPAAYGLTNTMDRCYTGDDLNFTGGGTTCPNPDEYVFWDSFHPTAVVHKFFAEDVLAAITAGPTHRHPWPLLLPIHLGKYLQQIR